MPRKSFLAMLGLLPALSLAAGDVEHEEVALLREIEAPQSEEHFASALAVDGERLVCGAWGDEQAFIYHGRRADWQLAEVLQPSDAAQVGRFGFAVDISGDRVAIGSPHSDALATNAGSVVVYRAEGDAWVEDATVFQPNAPYDEAFFGFSLALDGDTLCVSAPWYRGGRGAAFIFRRHANTWVHEARLVAPDNHQGDNFGFAVALHGNTVLIGAPGDDEGGVDRGAAYVFEFDGVDWTYRQKIVPSGAGQEGGLSVGVDPGDEFLAVGSGGGRTSRGVFIYERMAGQWQEVQKVTTNHPHSGRFAVSIATNGRILLIGAPDTDLGSWVSGMTFIFRHNGSEWVETDQFVASNNHDGDHQGTAVAIQGRTCFVGADRFPGRGRIIIIDANARANNRFRDTRIRSGELRRGDRASLRLSDDDRLVIESTMDVIAENELIAFFEFDAFAAGSPSSKELSVNIESQLNEPGGIAIVWAMDWQTGQWARVGDFAVGMQDVFFRVEGLPFATFRRQTDGRVSLRLGVSVPVAHGPGPLRVFLDEVRVGVRSR